MTLGELLDHYGVDEAEFVAGLSRELRAVPDSAASRLTEAEESVLARHGGITPTVDRRSAKAAALRSATSNLAEQMRESLSVEQAARLLGVDGSRVRHRVRDRALYAFKIGAGLRLPLWQFEGNVAIPGVRAVLAALPNDLHPLEVSGFMTTPDFDLAIADEAVSPRDWLIGGGAVAGVVERAEHLDEW